MPEVNRKWTLNGKTPLSPSDLAEQAEQYELPDEWHGLCNGLSVPRGAEVGEAHFLLREADATALENATVTIQCVHENGTTRWKKWYYDRRVAVTCTDSKPAYWVVFKDLRSQLEASCDGIRLNLRGASSSYITSTTNGGTPYTWQTALAALWAKLPADAGTCPTIPYSYTTTPENLAFDGIGVLRAINQLLTAIGCCLVLDPFEATFSVVDLRVSQTFNLIREKRRLIWSDEADGNSRPATVNVLYVQNPRTELSNALSPFRLLPQVYSGSVGGSSGEMELIDTMFYESARSMTARTLEVASALSGLLHAKDFPFGAIYSGILTQIKPGSRMSCVRWYNDGSGTATQYFYEASEIDWPVIPLYDGSAPSGGVGKFALLGDTHTSLSAFAIANQATVTCGTFNILTPYAATFDGSGYTVTNPNNLIGFAGDTALATYDVENSLITIIKIYPAKTRRFYFELTADWPDGLDQTSTNATFLFPDPTHQGGNTNLGTFTLRDRFNLASNAKGTGETKDRGTCQFNYWSGEFDILEISHELHRGRAEISTTFSGAPATFEVTNVVGFDGRAPVDDPLTITNELSIGAGSSEELIEIRWNSITGKYYALSARPGAGKHIQGTVTAISVDVSGPYTGKKVASVTVEVAPCDEPSLLGATVSVVDWSGCIFDHETMEDLIGFWIFASKGCAASLESGAEPGTLTPCHWVATARCRCVGVADVRIEGLELVQELCDGSIETIVDLTTDCP